MKKIMILGASEFQIPLLKQAKKMGLGVSVLDFNPNAPAVAFADEYFKCSLKDVAMGLEIARKIQPDYVTAGMCDVAVVLAAHIAKELSVPGIDIDVAERATDKYRMIQAFEANDVPHPFYRFVSADEIASFNRENLKYPLIVKPVDMAGSRGINLIRNADDFEEMVMASSAAGDHGDILLEEYMQGPEVSVELLVVDKKPTVLQITDKITSGPPHFLETGHVQPSAFPISVKEKIELVACNAARALDLNNTIAHAEIILTNEGPKMVEIGARMGGGGIHQQLIELSTGINLQEISIRLAMGENVDIPRKNVNKASAIKFIISKNGKIEHINGVRKAERVPFVTEIKIWCKNGDICHSPVDSSGRLGYVISQADTQEQASRACEQAISLIDIQMLDTE